MVVIRRADRLRAALAALPLDDPAALVADPRACTEAVFELEQRFVQPAGAHVVAVPEQLGAPGDFVTTTIGTDAVVAVRDRDGALRAMSNVCTHRASLLLAGAGNCGRNMTCPYHGWIFGLDGRLLGVPYRTGFDDVAQDDLSLATWPISERGGLMIIDPRRPTDATLGRPDWAALPTGAAWRHDDSVDVDLDWKTVLIATLADEVESVVATIFPACTVVVLDGRLVVHRCEPLAPGRTRAHRFSAAIPADRARPGSGSPAAAREHWARNYATALSGLAAT